MSRYQEGLYVLRVTGQGFGESDQKKTPFFFLQCLPEEQVFEDGNQPCDQYPAEVVFWITEKTFDRTMRELESLGFTGKKLSNLDPDTPGYFDLTGVTFTAQCTHKSGTGDNAHKVYDSWGFPYQGKVRESTPAVSKKLDSMFSKELKARAPKQPEKAPVPTSAEPIGSPPDDDVPF